jgi:hypothetical protein
MAGTLKGIVDQIGNLSAGDFTSLQQEDQAKIEPFITALLPSFSDTKRSDLALRTVTGLSAGAKAQFVKRAFHELPRSQQESIAGFPLPTDEKVRASLWRLVVWAFAIVLVGSFATLATGVFLPAQGTVTPELILSLFTSVVGFLAGLFIPSPAQNRPSPTPASDVGKPDDGGDSGDATG